MANPNKSWRFLVAGVAITTLLAGCAATSAPSSSSTSKPVIAGSMQLSYWGSSSRVTKTNNIIQLFTTKYPKVQVQPQVGDFSTYFQKLNVQAASKTMPCVAAMQTRQLNDYTNTGVMKPLDAMVNSGQIDASSIPKSVLDGGRGPDGKLYMIPFGIAWNAIMINQAMAKQYNIPILPNTYSWSQYVDWLKNAKSKLPAGIAPTNLQGGLESVFSAYVIANGQKLFSSKGKIAFTKKLLTEYWTNWETLRKDGLTNSAQNASDEPSQIEQSYVVRGNVLSEQTAGNALVAATAAAPEKDLTTVPFSSGKAGLGNMFFTSGWSIPSNCSNTASAAAFINFWTNDNQAAAIFNSDNGAVANSKQLKIQIATPVNAATKQELQVYQFILNKKVPQPTMPAGYNATFEQSFLREYQNISFGKETVSQAVDAFFTEANAGLGN